MVFRVLEDERSFDRHLDKSSCKGRLVSRPAIDSGNKTDHQWLVRRPKGQIVTIRRPIKNVEVNSVRHRCHSHVVRQSQSGQHPTNGHTSQGSSSCR